MEDTIISVIALVLAVSAWLFAFWVMWRDQKRWATFGQTVIPGSPKVTIKDIMMDQTKSPYFVDEPVYLGRLAATKAAQAAYEHETARVRLAR